MKEEFYTRGRWQNWINKIKESGFTLKESDEDPSAAVFVYAMDDVVLACLKVIARCEHGTISKEEAMSTIDEIRDIVSERDESLGEDANLMLESLNASLSAVFLASQRYIDGGYDKKTDLGGMVKRAVIAEEAGATVSDFDGRRYRVLRKDVVAAPPALHPYLLATIRSVPDPAPDG